MISENSSPHEASDELPVRGNGKCIVDSVAKKADEGDVLKKKQDENKHIC